MKTTHWLLLLPLLAAPHARAQSDDMPLTSRDLVFAGTPSLAELEANTRRLVRPTEALPSRYDALVAYNSPVKSQGQRGVCTIFSTTALMEHLYLRAGYTDVDFSEQYLQWAVKNLSGQYPNSEGSNNDANMVTIYQHGVVTEDQWPYEAAPWTTLNDASCDRDTYGEEGLPTRCYTNGEPPATATYATKYGLPLGAYLQTSPDVIKSWMAQQGTGVVVGLDFFYQSWNHRKSTLPVSAADLAVGIVRYPNAADVRASHEHPAGHGVLIVGWDDSLQFPLVDGNGQPVVDRLGRQLFERGFYLIKNSWGTEKFGAQNPYGAGYGYLSYRYVQDYGNAVVGYVPAR